MIEELSDLSAEDRETLRQSLPSLILQGDETELALLRLKKIEKKMDPSEKALFNRTLSKVVVALVRRELAE